MDRVLTKEEWKRKRKIKRYIRLGIVCAIALLMLIIAIIILKTLFSTVFTSKDTPAKRAEALLKQINIEKKYIRKNEYTRSGQKMNKVNGIVIHYVGVPNQSAKERWTYYDTMEFKEDKKTGSCHYIVGFDGEIINAVPLDEIAYASKERNIDTISIEYVHTDYDGKPSIKTYNELVKLTAYLMEKHGLEIKDIMMHYEITEYPCPPYFVDNLLEWEAFKADVKNSSDNILKK